MQTCPLKKDILDKPVQQNIGNRLQSVFQNPRESQNAQHSADQ